MVKPIKEVYDIAVKVSLQKCLKMLVVDDQQSAQICSEFLKEKQISMEVLVLENVPDKQIPAVHVHPDEGVLVYEVVEVPRSEPLLDRAVRYFINSKVYAKSFDIAVRLQQKGFKDIVTQEGTCFKQGMISGGHQ